MFILSLFAKNIMTDKIIKPSNKMLKFLTKSIIAFSVPAILVLTSCGSQEKSPMLEGQINASEPTEITFVYDIDGDVYHHDITTDSAGVFTYNPEISVDGVDLAIYVGHDIYGAYIEKGKSARMTIDGDNVAFDGDNIDRNDFVNAYEKAYSVWKFKPTPDKPFNYDEYCAMLDKGYSDASAKLEAISDTEVKNAYSRRNEARHKYYILQNLKMHKMFDGADIDAQYDSIVATIDPNADEARFSGLINYWYNSAKLGEHISTNDVFEFFPAMFGQLDSALTNNANKKNMYLTIGNMFFMYQPDDSTVEVFMEKVKPYIADAPTVQAAFSKIIEERAKIVKDGSPLPCDPILIAPDGSKTTLSAELQGKVVYIDIWATWCGPCCREIPFMEKVVEKFKGNDKIRFISISEDEDRDAWLEKLDRDKPEWPQFIFDQKTGIEFRKAMSINGIPRFLLIGHDGRFIAVDAMRPSNENIVATLNAAIAE